jgi:hypothetical protein
MSASPASYEIHSAARGPHWIAWVTRSGSQQPERSVVLIGKTQEEAEANAKAWAQSIDM